MCVGIGTTLAKYPVDYAFSFIIHTCTLRRNEMAVNAANLYHSIVIRSKQTLSVVCSFHFSDDIFGKMVHIEPPKHKHLV